MIFNIIMSAENSAGRPASGWLRQDILMPRIVGVDQNGKITYELGRRQRPDLSETMRLMAEYESDPKKLANEKQMIKNINAFWEELNPKTEGPKVVEKPETPISNAAD